MAGATAATRERGGELPQTNKDIKQIPTQLESLKKVQASQKSQNKSVKVSSTKETMTRTPHTKEMVMMKTVVEENLKS